MKKKGSLSSFELWLTAYTQVLGALASELISHDRVKILVKLNLLAQSGNPQSYFELTQISANARRAATLDQFVSLKWA